MSKSLQPRGETRPSVRSFMLFTLLALVAALLAASMWNEAENKHMERVHPLPGAELSVNGRPMHIDCTGHGSPTVVFESGLGDEWWEWQKVQPELSNTTEVCSYDRAGLGGSASQPGARDALQIARQLHALLEKARVNGPLVLVGHSAGGLYIREFAGLYPAIVSGLVFVDAASPAMFRALPGLPESIQDRAKRHRVAWMEWFREVTGWKRLMRECRGSVPAGLEAYAIYDEMEECQSLKVLTALGEVDDFEQSAREVAIMPCCHNIPVLIISQDPDRPKQGWDAQSLAANPIWASLQEQLKTLSSVSRRIIARSAGHHIMIDRPDLLIANIRGLVLSLRAGTSFSKTEGIQFQ